MAPTKVPSAPPAETQGFRPSSSSQRLWWTELGNTVMAAGILVQATLAGQIITGNHWLVTAHRIVAEFLPLLAVGLIVMAWMDRGSHRSASSMVAAQGAALVLLIAQTGLGFIGRNAVGAVAIHVPLGVGLLGLYVGIATQARAIRLSQGRPGSGPMSQEAP